MFTDFAAVVVPMVLGLMGAYISIRPPKHKHHWSWFIIFILLGIFSAATSWLQINTNALEVEESKQDLNMRISVLQRNINQLTSVPKSLETLQTNLAKTDDAIKSGAKQARSRVHIQRFQLHPIVSDQPVKLNVYFQNAGELAAEWEGYYFARVINLPPPNETHLVETKFFNEFLERMKELKPVVSLLPAGAERFVTDIGPMVRAEQLELLKSGKSLVIFVGRLLYRDNGTLRRTDYCLTTFGTVIFMCQRHNEES